jgi:transketolase
MPTTDSLKMNARWKQESQRGQYGKTLVELGKTRSDIVVLNADLSSSVKTDKFAEEFPERFFNMGVAEQNMMGVAAGLAASGKIVFASTFAVFATGRAYDQVRQSIAYTKLNVKIVASHAGITVGGDGASHQSTEDIALMRVLPNMTVIVPCDAPETNRAIRAAVAHNGPVYMRLGRGDIPILTGNDDPFEIGKATVLLDGSDVTLIGMGIMVSMCLLAADELKKHGISARVINMSTIKPIDSKTIIKAARETGGIVTAEEHSLLEGMGAAVALELVENEHVPMKRVGIPDVFGESGESDELMEKYGLTIDNIVDAAHDVMKRKK